MIKAAVDLHRSGSSAQTGPQSATLNEELMTRVRADGRRQRVGGRTVRCAARPGAPSRKRRQSDSRHHLVLGQGHINGGIRGTISADARDIDSANNLRDVVRGFLALAKMQAGNNPSSRR